VLIDFH